MTGFTAAERAVLDSATPPPMRPGLTADIVAAASAGRAPMRRRSRGRWQRHGRVLIGVGALLAASATAAATGLLDRLPIRIPGITRTIEAPKRARPKLVHVVRPRAQPVEGADAVALAALAPSPTPTPEPAVNWQRQQQRRAALIAAGIPPGLAARPMLARALAEQAGGPPAGRRAAVIAEWQRLKALPPAERKAAITKVRTDFLARHPQLAAKYEQRLEARSMRAAAGDERSTAPAGAVRQATPPDPQVAADRRRAWWQWRMARRASLTRNGAAPPPPAAATPQCSPPQP